MLKLTPALPFNSLPAISSTLGLAAVKALSYLGFEREESHQLRNELEARYQRYGASVGIELDRLFVTQTRRVEALVALVLAWQRDPEKYGNSSVVELVADKLTRLYPHLPVDTVRDCALAIDGMACLRLYDELRARGEI
jgi:hypothetical protein